MSNLATERFRILVIGNANAGKTTILKKVCHAMGREPNCFDSHGNPRATELEPSAVRGEHDIENSFQYPTAHGFVFHDSRGFEAGATGELDAVTDFIAKRSGRTDLKDRLHVIWYCISTSADRPMTEAGKKLFEIDTGNVPIVAIFTKMDGLEERAFNELAMEGIFDEERVATVAEATFQRNYLVPLQAVKHQPRYIVQLRDMHEEATNCNELITKTSEALDGETLKLFCLSILRNDMESCIKQVINQIIIPKAQEARESGMFSDEQAEALFCDVMCFFPHMMPSFDELIDRMDRNAVNASMESVERRGRRDRRGLSALVLRGSLVLSARVVLRDSRLLSSLAHAHHLQNSYKVLSVYMPSEAHPQCRAVWIAMVTMAIADLCLFTSLSSTYKSFQKAVDFCMHASSYPNLMSAVEKECSITDGDVVPLLAVLKANRDCYKS